LENNPIETQEDMDALRAFIKTLLKKFGFKGNVDDFISAAMSNAFEKKNVEDNRIERLAISEYGELTSLGAIGIMSKIVK
jgi:hypothetical protein